MAWNIPGLEDPSSDEFLKDPDFRQIAAFFLGWVPFYSAQIILSSPLLRENFTRTCLSFRSFFTRRNKSQPEPNDLEAQTHTPLATAQRRGEKTPGRNTEFNIPATSSQLRAHEGNALLVTLAVCFTCASVAHFVSLLRYTTVNEPACAFLVAWGGTAAQAGRLIGLLILSLELKKFVGRGEIYTFWALLLVLLGSVIANNAIAVGTLRPVLQLGISLCYRRHFAPTGLASSLALICTEFYLVIRFMFLISPKCLGWSSKLDTLGDSRVYRTLSLLLLDGLTITSAIKSTYLLVDFIPFAVGAVVVLIAFDLALVKTEKWTIPSTWSFCGETRRFTLHPTPAPTMASTMSIRRMSGHTTYTISLTGPDFPDDIPPPAPTRSALSLRVALRNFTAQEQENSRAVLDGHKAVPESPTLPHSAPVQLQTSARSPVRRFFIKPSERFESQSIRTSSRKGHRPQVTLVIDSEEQFPEAPQVESSVPSDSGAHPSDLLQMPPPWKHSTRTNRSSTSSGLTYLTPISQKNTSSRRPSYLLSPSRSYQQSMASTPHTPIPTWEEVYRQQGPQFDSRLEIPPLPSRSGSTGRQSTLPPTPVGPYAPFITGSPVSPPPGLTKFQPITHPSLLANTPPVERASGIKGPRPLVTASRLRNSTLMDSS